MKKIIVAMLIAVACPSVRAANLSWDTSADASLGAWQSLTSIDQAFGVSKRIVHLDQDTQPLLNVGLFAGASKPLVGEPRAPTKVLGGLTVAVPGSLLDWALGTNWGSQWIPALKTGVLCAYDVTRIKMLKARPDFVGIGLQYPLGGK